MTTVEPCTTSSANRLHYSINLRADVAYRIGRVGTTLCQNVAADEVEANRHVGTMWGPKERIVVADLPACKVCVRAAAKLENADVHA